MTSFPAPEETSAIGLVRLVTDTGSFEAWDEDVVSSDPLAFKDRIAYRERLAKAAERAGTSEAVLTGRARIGGQDLVLIVGEFAFLGGSQGVATGERVARAFDRARELRLPMLVLPTSGGTRMQEGALAFLQIAKVADAIERFRAARLPALAYLRNPTMGGVLLWSSLLPIIFAEPGALIGFSGPRVIEITTGTPLPERVQVAENLLAHGLLDDVFPPSELVRRMSRVLSVVAGTAERAAPQRPVEAIAVPAGDAWASVGYSREAGRPGPRELLDAMATDMTFLRGDRCGGGDDQGCLAALARVRGIPAVVVASDRRGGRGSRIAPAGYRKARRAMAIAGEFGLPLVTLIDTPHAELSQVSEEGGLSAELGRCIATMLTLPSPTLAVLLGEGGGGGALALFCADRVVCAEHAWLAPITPEGASAIVYRTTDRAPELAAAQGGASWDLKRFRLVDTIVPERPRAAEEPEAFVQRIAATVGDELARLVSQDQAHRLATRAARYRAAGKSGRDLTISHERRKVRRPDRSEPISRRSTREERHGGVNLEPPR